MFSAKLRSLVLVVLVAYIQSSYADDKEKTCYSKLQALEGDDMTKMLAEHNKIRSRLSSKGMKCKTNQPRSQPLPDLQWDSDLAEKACDVCKLCKRAHLPVEGKLEKKYTCVGQNFFQSTVTDDAVNSVGAVAGWVKECDNYNVKDLKKNNFDEVARWTQLVWNETKYVGCCQSTFTKNGQTEQLITCNYGPCGNRYGRAAYTPLKP